MDLALLVAYVALVGVTYARARSTAWQVVMTSASVSLLGVVIMALREQGIGLDRIQYQVALTISLGLVAVLAWVPKLGFGLDGPKDSVRRQGLAIWLPAGLVLIAFVLVSTWLTEQSAFLRPVSYLMGNAEAEDNAKWLEFTAQLASGSGVHQAVPLGGPLELVMTGIATVMGVVSQFTLGGYNEVAVAANTVVYGEFIMVALVLLALAPLAEARLRSVRIPLPLIWISAIFLAAVALVLVGYGHLTLQYTLLITGLWSAVFLSGFQMRRGRLLTSLAVAATMTVWLPLNAVAVLILGGWLVILVWRAFGSSTRSPDFVAIGLTVIFSLLLARPIISSVTYSLAIGAAEHVGGAARGVVAAVRSGLQESPLFTALGGTEQTTAILAILAAASVIGAGLYLQPIAGPLRSSLVRRFAPIALLALSALAIYLLDFWSTGEGPHYGSLKFTFLLVVVALATTMPIALMLIDRDRLGAMTQLRWIAIGGILILLMIDSLLPRAVAVMRPQEWSPPIPFDNTSGSYWYPAEVNGTANQPISSVPVACVYLPQGSSYPTAIVPSGLSDAQRVYGCTRLLIGLSGEGVDGQFLIDWIRREWTTNTPAWTDVYDGLALVPPAARARPIILLDDGSNVIGLESLDSLLQRFPKPASQG